MCCVWVCRKTDQWEKLHKLHVVMQEEFDTYKQTATTDINNLKYVNEACHHNSLPMLCLRDFEP